MSQNPFEPGQSVLDNITGGPGLSNFEPPSSLIVYALYASAAADGIQIPVSMLLGEGEETIAIWGAIGVLQFVVFIASVVIWCQWKMRAARNIRVFSEGPFEFTPGWCAGWYFVPFLNLVRPYQAMKEIMAHSTPGGGLSDGGIIGAWWAAWIISNVIANFSMRIEGEIAALLANVTGIVAAILAVRVVKAVNEAQLQASRMMPVR
jgi:hypothetical protein